MKYVLLTMVIVIESLHFLVNLFDELPGVDWLPICTPHAAMGKIMTHLSLLIVFIDTAPVLIYGLAYMQLYRQYKKFAAECDESSGNILDVKKRLRNKVIILSYIFIIYYKLCLLNTVLIFLLNNFR